MTSELLMALVVVAKTTLVLGAALVSTRWMRGRPAAERHLVWMLATVAVLLLPVLTLVLPAWRMSVPVPVTAAAVVSPAPAPAPSPTAVDVASPQPAVAPHVRAPVSVAPASGTVASPAAVPLQSRSARSALSVTAILALVWLAGVLGTGSIVLFGFARVGRLAARAHPLRDPALVSRAHSVAAELGVTRPVRLLEGDVDAMPITFGVFRASLLLPSSALDWTPSRQQAVLRHELAHVRRRDSLTQLIAEIACAIHWFNPLAWLAARRLCVEREHACDDAVLAAGVRPAEYASELLDIARSMRAQRGSSLAAIAMARPSQLRSRLQAVLDQRQRSTRVPRRLLAPAWLGACALIVPLSMAAPSLSQAQVPQPPQPAQPPMQAAPPSPAAPEQPPARLTPPVPPALAAPGIPAAPVAPDMQPAPPAPASSPPPAGQHAACPSGGRVSNMTSNVNNDRRTIKWSGPDCSGDVVVDGDVTFDPSFRTVAGLSSNGYMSIEVREGRDERRVVIRPSNGGLSYEYSVRGARQSWDDSGREWLETQLLFMFRNTGFMAEERATAMLRQGGPSAVLTEVEQLRSDYGRATYLTVAVRDGRLDEDALRRVLTVAGSTLTSDYYRASVITAAAGSYEFRDGHRRAYLDAVSGLGSDYYRHSALSALLSKGDLSDAQVADLLRESNRISSDYYRASMLTDLGGRYASAPAMRSAYLEAVAGISSDYYRAEVLASALAGSAVGAADLPVLVNAAAGISSDYYRQAVLTRIVARDDIDRATLIALIDAVSGISSDHYASIVLVEIASRHTLEGDARERFVAAMDGIRSGTYRGRVAEALAKQTR